jgi:4-hydroxybenzoyl-CoA thioesterase/acyl-CoA thioester hydrolase
MVSSYKTTRRVEFRDTDAAGIMHFSTFFTFMEEAEHELLRHVGLSVLMHDDEGKLSWPRVAASCDFLSAVRFEDELEIQVHLARLGEKSLRYEFGFFHAGMPVAIGQMTTVCCRFEPNGQPRAVAIPPWIVEKLSAVAATESPPPVKPARVKRAK